MTRGFEMALLQKWPSKKIVTKKQRFFAFFWLWCVIAKKVNLLHKKSYITLKDQYVSYKLLFSLLLYHQYFSSYDFWTHLRLLCTWDLQPCHIYFQTGKIAKILKFQVQASVSLKVYRTTKNKLHRLQGI